MLPEQKFVQTDDGWALHLLKFSPKKQRFPYPLLCIHGFSQNHLAFTLGGFAQELADLGFVTYTVDLRGHGKSQYTSLSDSGDATSIPTWQVEDYITTDVPRALKALREWHDGIPAIVCGHSLGGIIAVVLAALKSQQEIAAVIPMASPLSPGLTTKRVRFASRVFLRLVKSSRLLRASWQSAPMDLFFDGMDYAFFGPKFNLSTLFPLLIRYDSIQVLPRLWHPHNTSQQVVREILQGSDAEPLGILVQVARWMKYDKILLGLGESEDFIPRFREITQPVLGFWGDEDLLAPPTSAGNFFQLIQSQLYRFQILSKTNHIDITSGLVSRKIARSIADFVELSL